MNDQPIVRFDDPRALRALAHPARWAVLEFLGECADANASECAAAAGLSTQAVGHHLRVLQKWGLTRQVPSDDGRETRWALAAPGFTFSTTSPATRGSALALQERLLARDDEIVADYLSRRDLEDPAWQDAAVFASGTVYATEEELNEVSERVRAIIRGLERLDPDDRPDAARRVHWVLRAVPQVERGVTRDG
jgi:DNA-binding transcriptional ArsR family regulator